MSNAKQITSYSDVDVTYGPDGKWHHFLPGENAWSSAGYYSMEEAQLAAVAFNWYSLVPTTTPTIESKQHFDGYDINTYTDGTYGYMMSDGTYKDGYKSKDGAKKAAIKLAAKSKTPSLLKSEMKDGYSLNTFADGTYGYVMPDGTHKEGYKSKDGANKAGKKLAAKTAKAKAEEQVKVVDKQAEELAVKLQNVYKDAVAGMTQKLTTALAAYEKQRQALEAAAISGEKLMSEYAAWCKSQLQHNDQIKALKKALARDLLAADKMAIAYINEMPAGVYAEGMNFATYEIEHGAKIKTSFTLCNKNTVLELVAKQPMLLPNVQLDKAKDLAWNQKHVTSAVTQSILQGESIPALAKRIAAIAEMDQHSAMRTARTAMTSAHSLGKMKGYELAADLGIGVKKHWLAALDRRTRSSHRHLDGEIVALDEKFSNGLMYPGDPDGPGSEVYNCRCTLIPEIDGVPYDEVERASKLGDMSYEEWKGEKLAEAQASQPAMPHVTSAESLDAQLKYTEEVLDDLEIYIKENDKTYSGIWPQPVKLSEWADKIDSIPKKIAFYEEQLKTAVGFQIKGFTLMLDQVKEFDKLGSELAKHVDKYKSMKLQQESIYKQMIDLGMIEDSPYSKFRKSKALKFKTPEEADKVLRPTSGRVWAAAPAAQRNAIYGYTQSSGAWNRPLSGFQKPWNALGSGWEKKFFKGVNKVWIDYEGKGSAIRNMTKLIAQSTYDNDIWLVRGCDYNAMESFFDIDSGELSRMSTDEMRKRLVGKSNRITSFVSCGSAAGQGFSSKPVAMEIYCPAGSEMMYSEPFSHFSGSSVGKKWDGAAPQSYFGSEDETIIQRGGYYTVVDAYEKEGKMHIVMEHHPEKGYDKFQQDAKEWTGSKEQFK